MYICQKKPKPKKTPTPQKTLKQKPHLTTLQLYVLTEWFYIKKKKQQTPQNNQKNPLNVRRYFDLS